MIKGIIFIIFSALILTCGVFCQTPTSNKNGSFELKLGSEVLVSGHQNGGRLRCEPSVAIYKDTVIVAWNDSYGGWRGETEGKTGTTVGWAISSDRGKTFKFGGYLPLNKDGEPFEGADPILATDSEGNFYFSVLSWGVKPYEIQFYYMSRQNPGKWEKMSIAAIGESADKPSISVESEGNIGIAYNDGISTIKFVASVNNGKSWTKPIKISGDTNATRLGASIAMTKNRTVVSWAEGKGVDLNEVWWTESTDGGNKFLSPKLLFKSSQKLVSPSGYTMGLGYPSVLSSLPSLSSSKVLDKEKFFLTYAEGVGTGSRILLFTLALDSKNWSKPINIGESPEMAIKVMPAISAIDLMPAILYYDRRNNPQSSLTDAYLSIMENDGKFHEIKLNSISTDWMKTPGDKEFAPFQRNFGDYISLVADNNFLAAVWTDGRNGTPNIFLRTIEVVRNR